MLSENNKKIITKIFNLLNWLMVVVLVLGFFGAIFFHWVSYRGELYIFPKESISFQNTLIHEGDINILIDRFNDSSYFEKFSVADESLHKALKREGIIINKE